MFILRKIVIKLVQYVVVIEIFLKRFDIDLFNLLRALGIVGCEVGYTVLPGRLHELKCFEFGCTEARTSIVDNLFASRKEPLAGDRGCTDGENVESDACEGRVYNCIVLHRRQ